MIKNILPKNTTKLKIECLKPNHGKWSSTTYNGFINGKVGCPICNESKGANEVSRILEKYGYVYLSNILDRVEGVNYYMREFKFDDCKSLLSDIKGSRTMPFDFYLLDSNICIEYDGRQHYEPAFGAANLAIRKENDKLKNKYCSGRSGKPKLIRIPYWDFKNIENILVKKLKL